MIAADDWAVLVGLALAVCLALAGVSAYVRERREWNGGRCAVCQKPWLYFTRDSQGGLGFRCGCGRSCWVSYRSVMRSS